MISIREYHKILREMRLTEKDGHLLLPADFTGSNSKIVRKLFSALGDTRADCEEFRLQKLSQCNFFNCVSPQCHKFMLKNSDKNSLLTKEDIMQIAEEMDLDEIEELGSTEYLKRYNEHLPDILKVSNKDFRVIYAYMKGLK